MPVRSPLLVAPAHFSHRSRTLLRLRMPAVAALGRPISSRMQTRCMQSSSKRLDAPSASSSASTSSGPVTPSPSSSPQAPIDPSVPKLSWPEFFALRKRQRRLAVLASVPTTALGLSTGVSYFATVEAVPTELVFGLEPIWAYGLATIGCTLLGYLAGPSVGNLVFRMTVPRSRYAAMQARNAEFYEHVRRNRVDPSRQSVNNPVPDWFCEKPGSISQYRQWLRDQAAYRRKASQHGMLVGKADEGAKDWI